MGPSSSDTPGEVYVALGLDEEEQHVLFDQVLAGVDPARKVALPLPADCNGPLTTLLAGYTIVGWFQKGFPRFQNSIPGYKPRPGGWTWLPPLRY